MKLRPERPDETQMLRALTEAAFAPMSFSDGTEGQALDQLREDGDLVFSQVVEEGEEVIGHVALSPAQVGGAAGWYGLGPISVREDHQRRGVGSALMTAAIDWAKEQKSHGLVLLGNPAYYSRFGFISDEALTHLTVPSEYVQALSFSAPARGEIVFASALQSISP